MNETFANKIFDSLIYLKQDEFNDFKKVLHQSAITNERKNEFMFLVQLFAHVYQHDNFSEAYLAFPDAYLAKVSVIPPGQMNEFKELGSRAVNFHLEFQKILGFTGTSYNIALENVVSQNMFNENVLKFTDYTVFKDISQRFFADIKGETRFVAYAGMANYILYSSGNPLLFNESEYFNNNRKFGVPNSLLFNSQTISDDRKLTLSIREVNKGFEQKLKSVKHLVSDLRSDPVKVAEFKKNAPTFVQQYGLTIKDIDKENVHIKATIALGDAVVIETAKQKDVDLFLERMNQLGLYRLINVPADELQTVAGGRAAFFAVCVAAVFVAAAVAAAVVIVFVLWIDGIVVDDDNLGPAGIYSGYLLPEVKTLEIAQQLGGNDFKNEVIARMKLDSQNLLIQVQASNNNSTRID